MLSIHLEVQHFCDDGDTNYLTNEINKDMIEFCILIIDQKSEIPNIQQGTTDKPYPSFFEKRTSRGK